MKKAHTSVWSRARAASVAVSNKRRARGGTVAVALASTLAAGGAAAQVVNYNDGDVRTAPITISSGNVTLNNTGSGQARQVGIITGPGGVVHTGAGTLELNLGNSYAGGTVINSGTLIADDNHALGTGVLTLNGGSIGSTGEAVLANNVVVNASFHTAIIGPGVPPLPAALTLNGNVALNVDTHIVGTTPSVLALGGVISGNHALTLDTNTDYSVYVFRGTQSNTYTGLTTVRPQTILGVERTGGAVAISGDLLIEQGGVVATQTNEQIADNVTVTINSTGLYYFDGLTFQKPDLVETIGTLYGNGSIGLAGSKLAVGSGLFTGVVRDGTQGVGGQFEKVGSGTLTLSGANTYTGATTVSGGILRAGADNTLSAASAHTVAAGGTLDLAGFKQTVASMNIGGTVSLLGATTPGNTLTVLGPWVGNGGILGLGTALGNSASVSDRLVLSGASAVASGNTRVQITRRGGLGALTTGNGIEVVTALNGARTAPNAFTLVGGHLDVGAYEYRLYDGDAAGAGENWYLRSSAPGTPAVPTYRAEVPMFAALPTQVRQGNLAMLGNLHQRVGDEETAADADPANPRRAWARLIGADIDIAQKGAVTPRSEGRLRGLQAGTDLLATPEWRAGIYVGRLDGDVDVSGIARGVYGRVGHNDLRSDYLGGYATWHHDSGFYADAVVQGGRHRYTVDPIANASASGKGSSTLASLEVGQSFRIGERWQLEPQLQLVYQRVRLNDTYIVGARVQQDADSGWLVRAGLRLKGEFATSAGTLQPYARVNVYHAGSGGDIARFVGPAGSTDIVSGSGHTTAELAGGLTLTLNPTASLYGEVGKLWATGGDSRVKSGLQGSIGTRMRW